MTPSVVVLASGSGTNFEAIADAVAGGKLKAEIRAVLSDRIDAPVIDKAKKRGIEAVVVPFNKSEGSVEDARRLHDERVLAALDPFAPRFLVMAGYMRIASLLLIESFRGERGYSRIVNIHPSLLPAFPGAHAYAQAFRHGVQVTGATVHLLEEEVDAGPICAQQAFSIAHCKSESEVEELGKKIEHRLYPETLEWVLSDHFKIEQDHGRLRVCPN
jgi:phosphoribosylglycinamide formyltransferase-1